MRTLIDETNPRHLQPDAPQRSAMLRGAPLRTIERFEQTNPPIAASTVPVVTYAISEATETQPLAQECF